MGFARAFFFFFFLPLVFLSLRVSLRPFIPGPVFLSVSPPACLLIFFFLLFLFLFSFGFFLLGFSSFASALL